MKNERTYKNGILQPETVKEAIARFKRENPNSFKWMEDQKNRAGKNQ